MAAIEAEWALWGVASDSDGDYTVLACSDGRLRPGHFRQLITRFSPGTPEAEGALPRVTIGAVDVSKVPHLGMALQTLEHGQVLEATTTRFFFFPFQALGETRAAYLTLYEHLSRVELPGSGTGPLITVEPPALDPAAVAEELRDAEPDAAQAAALLARGRRVCVTQAEAASLEERLRFLDGVAAWLPYGYRAKLTATTWANSATPHRLRLFFARHAGGDGITAMPWRGAAPAPADPAVEDEHLAPLRVAIGRLGGAAVIDRLASDVTPHSCDDPEPAVRALAEMTRSLRVPDGELGLDELRTLFGGGPAPVDGPDLPAVRRALVRMIRLAEPQDWPLIERWWRELADEDATALFAAMTDGCRRSLWSGERTGFEAELLLAYRHGRGDEFLASLVAPPDEPAEAAERGARAAAGLVHDSVLVPGATAGHPRTLRAVLDHPLVLCAFVARISAVGRDRLGEGLLWLLSAPAEDPQLLVVLCDALAADDPDPLTPERLRRLTAAGRGCLAALLEGAAALERLHLVLGPFGELLAAGRLSASDSRYWAERLGALSPADPAAVGAIDVLLLALGERPTLPWSLTPGTTGDYRKGALGIWRLPWPDGGGPAPAVAALRERPDVQRSEGARELLAILEETADAPASRPRPPSPVQAEDRSRATVTIGEEAPFLQGADAVVHQLCMGYRRGLTLDTCVRRLDADTWPPTAALAVAVVRGLAPALVEHGASPEIAQDWSVELTRRLASGDFGRGLGRRFRRELLTAVTTDVRDRLALLSAAADEGPPLSGTHRQDLQAVHAELDRLLARSPSGERPQHIRYRKADRH
ncbi:hypothetical protein SAMN04489712_12288 [Thermomonospora echinospora]|uniref:Uncharacterized protein n=1 Tax=Thermomonospora echinospora TaxID=1992 RepID=A0A1H6DTZ7_9ACTN|nr:hypothetical protein [Thermomonospora echinospora]SEG88827.1 hypothetical protein SAMN04489712_12288 [Thermomonospora echinospora]